VFQFPVLRCNPVSARRVDSSDLVFSLSSHRHSEIGFYLYLSLSRFIINNFSSINLIFIFRCSSSPCNPVYTRCVDSSPLVISLSSHRHSYIGLIFILVLSIHNKNFCNHQMMTELSWLMWFTYCRWFRKHFTSHFLKIELNNWLLNMLQQSIKVSLIVGSVEQLIYLLITRWCVLSFLSITLQRHTWPLGRQNYFNKGRCGLMWFNVYGTDLGKKKLLQITLRLTMTIRRSLTPTTLIYR
jgi:hypothetical protein